ncbi:MAG: PCRF domain-containing protein [Candidatus Acidiferrales bacterium]
MANLTLFQKLENIESKYEELTQQLSSPEVHNDSARFQKLAKTHADMAEMVAKYREWKEIEKGLQGTKQMLVEAEDAELKQMAHDEEHALEARRETVERELKFLMLPKDPNDDKNVTLEIRAGTGGDGLLFSPANSSVCIPATPNRRAGSWKFWKARRPPSAA